MAQPSPPSSQKAGDRPISFLLDNQTAGAPVAFVDLVIRPEDLTRTDQSRLAVQQTLGGAFVDNFGAGVPTITLSGHTGWRRTASSDDDGLARFQALKGAVFDQWHEQRQSNIAAGSDPNDVRLIFSDALDDMSVVVAPVSFTLRRSRSRPLLAQYQIVMNVIDTALQNAPTASQFGFDAGLIGSVTSRVSALGSLTNSINSITSSINSVRSLVDSTLVAPVTSFMQQTAQLYGAVRGTISAATGVTASLVSVAQATAQAGVNLFRTLSAVASLPTLAKAQLQALSGAYSNIFCILRNAAGSNLFYEDYSTLYGASNCSSTVGGRPASTLAGVNPFYQVVPTSGPAPVSVTPSANAALSRIASSDPVLAPMTTASLGASLTAANDGMRLAA